MRKRRIKDEENEGDGQMVCGGNEFASVTRNEICARVAEEQHNCVSSFLHDEHNVYCILQFDYGDFFLKTDCLGFYEKKM